MSHPSVDSAVPKGPPPDLGRSMELVREARGGSPEALNELFLRYRDRIRRIARVRMGARVRSFMDSLDLVQNTYVVAMRRLESFEPRDHPSIIRWLARILENQIRDAADYADADMRNRDLEVPIGEACGDEESAGFAVTSREPLPWQSLEEEEVRRIFDECVRLLAPSDREVILLRDYAGGSWSYVARELDRPTPHAAQELHRRARKKLARLVARRIDFEG